MMRRFQLRVVLVSLLMGIPSLGFAQILDIEPAIVDSSSPVEQALKENKGRASTSIIGKGGSLAIEYFASQELEIYMVPLDTKDRFVPTDFLRFTLPATNNGNVLVHLTKSPGWRPAEQKWIIHLLSKDETTEAGFKELAFVPASPLVLLRAALRHLMTPEPYTPSSYHALRGYRIMNVQVSMALGILALIAGIVVLVFVKKEKKLITVLVFLLGLSALYQLRFSIDLLRFTNEHLRGYAEGNYDEAGSMYQVADVLKSSSATSVYVCRDGTNYKEKILRYMSYPIRISSEDKDAASADFAIVMDKGDWSLETRTENSQTLQTLRCGAVEGDAKKMTDFPDGSILFSLQKS